MSEEAKKQPSINDVPEEEVKLVGELFRIFNKASHLYITNMNMLTLPHLTLAAATIVTDASLSTSFLLGSFTSAACVQYARWKKSKIRSNFEKLWDEVPGPEDDPIQKEIDAKENLNPLIFLREAFERKADKSKWFISKKDFDITDPHKRLPVIMGIVGGAVGAFIDPKMITMAPYFFLTGTQAREWADSGRIVSRAQNSFEVADAQLRMRHNLPLVPSGPRVVS